MINDQSATIDEQSTYDTVAVTLHWIVALLVVGLATLGLYMETIKGKAQDPWVNVHGCLGLVLTALVIARLAWRIKNPPPPLPADTGAFSRLTSPVVHWLLYAILLVIVVPGVIAFVWHGRAFDYGLFALNFGVPSDRNVFKPAENLHGWIAYALMGLASLHALAALVHQFVWRDRILRRMIPALQK